MFRQPATGASSAPWITGAGLATTDHLRYINPARQPVGWPKQRGGRPMRRLVRRLPGVLSLAAICLLLPALCAACGRDAPLTPPPVPRPGVEEVPVTLTLTSDVFTEGDSIPVEYTCEGDNVSPPLRWAGFPSRARSFALICDDLDALAGVWVHWVMFDIPAGVTELDEMQPDLRELPNGAKNGRNSFKNLGYGGPCPPPGKAHRYFFKLYALDKSLNLQPGVTKDELLSAMQDHVLAEGQLMGTYQRR
jgi:Raf kinase inhibitor-like YbhB/YbcL family protein